MLSKSFSAVDRAFLFCLLLLLTLPVTAENWPHWRGPHFDGTTAEKGLPTEWSYGEKGATNILWKAPLPGWAASSPIVWDGQIFVTSTEKGTDTLWVLAFDHQGDELWRQSVDAGAIEVFAQFAHETNVASPSPVTDGDHLFALFGTGKLFAFDMDGKKAWTADLAERYGAPNMFFGLSSSPLLLGDRLFLHLLHADAQLVIALDAATGKEMWKQERATDATGECLHAYTSLVPFEPAGGGEVALLVHGSDYLTGHSPRDGEELWRYGTLNPKDNYNSFFRLVATPVSSDGLIVTPTAKRGPVFGLRPGSGGEGTAASSVEVAWKLDAGTPDVPSPVIADGLVYLAGENGRLTVLDVASGEQVYAERVHQGPHRGSPVLADGKLFLTAADGTVSVIKPGRQFEILAKNQIEGGRLAASPAISDQVIYLRTAEALFAVASKVDAKDDAKADSKPEESE